MPLPVIQLSKNEKPDLSSFSEVELLRGVLDILAQRAELNFWEKEKLRLINEEFIRRESVAIKL